MPAAFDPVILAGYSSQRRGQALAQHLGAECPSLEYIIHHNGEIKPVAPNEANLRSADVIVLVGAAGTPDRNVAEAQFLQQIARNGHARRITTVVPYLFYGRQDSNFDERAPIGLTVTLENLAYRTDSLIICDPHNSLATTIALESRKNFHYDSMHYAPVFQRQMEFMINSGAITAPNVVVMGLDKGGAARMTDGFLRAISDLPGVEIPKSAKHLPHLDKDRDRATGQVKFHGVKNADPADIRGKDVIIFEDMVDTGGTVIDGGQYLKQDLQARSVTLFATSGLFSPKRETRKIGDTILTKVRSPRPDSTVKNIDKGAKNGIDAIFVMDHFDFALTDPLIAEAIEKSPIIHEMESAGMMAEVLFATHSNDRGSNSVSRRLAGDASLFTDREGYYRPTPLKPNSPLLALRNG